MASETTNVTYQIDQSVEVDGVAIKPGRYPGRRVRIKSFFAGQPVLTEPEYKIDYEDYGDLDCTHQVADGQIKIIQ